MQCQWLEDMVMIKRKHPVSKRGGGIRQVSKWPTQLSWQCNGKPVTKLFLVEALPNKSTRMVEDVDTDNPL